jgi:cytochrome b involved in lipid metabolism
MVVREADELEDFHVKVEGRWFLVDKKFLQWHPGGNALVAYKNKDATTAFHTFHVGSKWAYSKLAEMRKQQPDLKVCLRVSEVFMALKDRNYCEKIRQHFFDSL